MQQEHKQRLIEIGSHTISIHDTDLVDQVWELHKDIFGHYPEGNDKECSTCLTGAMNKMIDRMRLENI
jgi:hypothetical protein